jgi:hypothetical protein
MAQVDVEASVSGDADASSDAIGLFTLGVNASGDAGADAPLTTVLFGLASSVGGDASAMLGLLQKFSLSQTLAADASVLANAQNRLNLPPRKFPLVAAAPSETEALPAHYRILLLRRRS